MQTLRIEVLITPLRNGFPRLRAAILNTYGGEMPKKMPKKPLISIVDDDESVREGTMDLVRSMGFVAKAFPHPEDPQALLEIRWRVRMRIFIFALATIASASCVIDQAGAADRLPAFDIARNCNAETAGVAIGTGVEGCTKDETNAKNEVAKRWSQFGASEKKFCVGESSTGGEQSYVDLLTCLEMSAGQFSDRQQ